MAGSLTEGVPLTHEIQEDRKAWACPRGHGRFGIGEILSATEQSMVREVYRPRLAGTLDNWRVPAIHRAILRGSGIGFFMSFTGCGHILSSFVTIPWRRGWPKGEEFGHGRIEGWPARRRQ